MRVSLIILMMLVATKPGFAETWTEQKCATFAEAWTFSAPPDGPGAPSRDFREKIEAFIASQCVSPRDACPTTEADIEILDALALIVAVEGMTTTFLPIQCPTATGQ